MLRIRLQRFCSEYFAFGRPDFVQRDATVPSGRQVVRLIDPFGARVDCLPILCLCRTELFSRVPSTQLDRILVAQEVRGRALLLPCWLSDVVGILSCADISFFS